MPANKPSVISLHTQLTHSSFQQAQGLDKVHLFPMLSQHRKHVGALLLSFYIYWCNLPLSSWCLPTLPAPTGPPLNISHSSPTPSTLILTWSPPDPSYRNGVVRGYLVVISEMETSRLLYFNTSTPPLSIPSLHPFYTYNCSVSAYTVGLPGPYSPPYLVRMPQSGKWYLME